MAVYFNLTLFSLHATEQLSKKTNELNALIKQHNALTTAHSKLTAERSEWKRERDALLSRADDLQRRYSEAVHVREAATASATAAHAKRMELERNLQQALQSRDAEVSKRVDMALRRKSSSTSGAATPIASTPTTPRRSAAVSAAPVTPAPAPASAPSEVATPGSAETASGPPSSTAATPTAPSTPSSSAPPTIASLTAALEESRAREQQLKIAAKQYVERSKKDAADKERLLLALTAERDQLLQQKNLAPASVSTTTGSDCATTAAPAQPASSSAVALSEDVQKRLNTALETIAQHTQLLASYEQKLAAESAARDDAQKKEQRFRELSRAYVGTTETRPSHVLPFWILILCVRVLLLLSRLDR
jgi:hypothetical protein